jgi:hypothetical protein
MPRDQDDDPIGVKSFKKELYKQLEPALKDLSNAKTGEAIDVALCEIAEICTRTILSIHKRSQSGFHVVSCWPSAALLNERDKDAR